jgi:DNA-binding CsgD family transcriptional regulator
MRGPRNQLAGISLASSEEKDSFDGNTDLITAYCNHFYLRYRRLHKIEEPQPLNICLTEREREILKWFKAGKSGTDVAAILAISTHVVDFHTRNIFRKLDAGNKTLAVVKAIDLGLV